MLKITFLTLLVVCSFSIAQNNELNSKNTELINDFTKKLINNPDETSYLLKCDNNINKAFLVYRFKNNIIVSISSFTFDINIHTTEFKKEMESLGAMINTFEHVNEETGEVINKINTYEFKIDLNNIERFKRIVFDLLTTNDSETNKQDLLYYESTGL